MKTLNPILLGALALCIAMPAGAASNAPKPKLSMDEARVLALKIAPGQVEKSDYEKEDGIWRYSFDIAQGKQIHEIGIDAMTGKTVEDSIEKPGTED